MKRSSRRSANSVRRPGHWKIRARRGQFGWLEDLGRDLRYCARALRRSPGFTAAAVLSLALGIGANTTVFSMVKAVLLGSLPVRDADRLVSFHQSNGAVRLSLPDFEDYRQQAAGFEDIAAAYPAVSRSLHTHDDPERLWGQLVTTNYFTVLGAQPALGRGFAREEHQTPVIVISDSLWRRTFGADARVIGQTIDLGGKGYLVVGCRTAQFPWRAARPSDRFLDPARDSIGKRFHSWARAPADRWSRIETTAGCIRRRD